MQEEGLRALAKGWAPTAIGYSMQGLGKFGFYEVFKIFYGGLIGEVCFRVWTLCETDNINFISRFFGEVNLFIVPTYKV